MSTRSAAVRGWTYEEFARLPDDGNRYEVIAGDVYVTPAPGSIHQKVSARFFTELRVFATNQHRLGEVLYAPLDVILDEAADYVQPDVVFLRRERGYLLTRRGIEGPPDLVVEILSPTTALQDRGIKRLRYAHFGVPEYWIVDTERHRVEVYRLQDDADDPILVTDRLRWQPVEGGPVLELNVAELLSDLV
ncbi:MAG TPA: Uma2 family endonuclease [Longimicrobium sp.]